MNANNDMMRLLLGAPSQHYMQNNKSMYGQPQAPYQANTNQQQVQGQDVQSLIKMLLGGS